MFFRRKFYIIRNEFVHIFNDHFNNTNLPNQLKHGARLVGRWMKQIDEEKTEIFAIWEYDSYEDYQTIESRVRADRAHIERVHRWYEKHGGKDHVLGAYIIEVKNEEIQSTLEEKK